MRVNADAKKTKKSDSLSKSASKSAATVTSTVHRRIVTVIGLVPRGKVATYGQIAALAGSPGQARQVVWALHSSSEKYKLPWHRVINAQGRIGHAEELSRLRQETLLEKEGIEVDRSGKIDLERFLWRP